jgi:hypothetical protein
LDTNFGSYGILRLDNGLKGNTPAINLFEELRKAPSPPQAAPLHGGESYLYSPIEGGFKGGVPLKLFSCLDFSFYPFEKYPDFVRCAKP